MANSNCNCSMSLLQEPCPRGVFPCSRCLAKMKNTGRVWQVNVPDIDIKVDLGGGLIYTAGFVPEFTTSLYWDFQGIPYTLLSKDLNSRLTNEETQCNNGIHAIIAQIDPYLVTFQKTVDPFPEQIGDGGNGLDYDPFNNGGLTLRLYLFWYNYQWHFSIYTHHYTFSDNPHPGAPSDEVITTTVANYRSSSGNICFHDDWTVMDRFEWYVYRYVQGGDFFEGGDVSDKIIVGDGVPFPNQITYRHVFKEDSNLILDEL